MEQHQVSGMADRLRRAFSKTRKQVDRLRNVHQSSAVEVLLIVKYVDQGTKKTRCLSYGDAHLMAVEDIQHQNEEQATSEDSAATNATDIIKEQLFNLSNFTKEDLRVEELRRVATQCVRATESRKQPLWGKEGKRPSWWPSDIPWCVKTELVNGQKVVGPTKKQLIQAIIACYEANDAIDLISGK